MVYLFLTLLEGTLVYRIWKASSFAQKLFLLLTFSLYLQMGLIYFVWTSAPEWLGTSLLGWILAGQVFFSSDFLIRKWRLSRDAARRLKDLKRQRGPYHELIQAAHLLSQSALGALILIERKTPLDSWRKKGICVDAKLAKETLFSIFSPPGALHDGAAMIQNDRIAAAGIIVPLTQNPSISKELGTRHRAALGFSEVSDGLCMVISEETGSISFADRGTLYYDIPWEKIPEHLEKALRFKLPRRKKSQPVREFSRAKN